MLINLYYVRIYTGESSMLNHATLNASKQLSILMRIIDLKHLYVCVPAEDYAPCYSCVMISQFICHHLQLQKQINKSIFEGVANIYLYFCHICMRNPKINIYKILVV